MGYLIVGLLLGALVVVMYFKNKTSLKRIGPLENQAEDLKKKIDWNKVQRESLEKIKTDEKNATEDQKKQSWEEYLGLTKKDNK